MVSHEGCLRKVPHDCRPAAEAGDKMLHQWKPAGVVMYESEVTSRALIATAFVAFLAVCCRSSQPRSELPAVNRELGFGWY